jgi:outer membrane protein assembly factor BamB
MLFWGSAVVSDPVAEDTTFIIGASDLRRVSRIDARTGRVYWRTDVYGWAWARPLETSDRIYESVASGTPYQMRHVASFTALDRATGAIIWRWPMPEWPGAYMNGFAGGAALAGDVVLAGGVDGTLYAFPAH